MNPNQTLPIDEILVEDRQRKDLGDLTSLSQSIKDYGLIQPIVVNQSKRLVAGGRRLAACIHLGWEEIPVVYIETLSERQLTILELEENIRRKEMSWVENTLAVSKIHHLHATESALAGDPWTQEMTGALLGVSTASVGFVIRVARELKDSSSAIHGCAGFTDALRWVMRKDEDKANAVSAQRIREQFRTPTTVVQIDGSPPSSNDLIIEPVPLHEQQTIPLSKMCLLGNSIEWMIRREEESIDHIITDPPYGIDIDMLEQNHPGGGMLNIDRIEDTHKVEDNLILLKAFIPQAYRILKPTGFLVFWCDAMNWQYLYDITVSSGFKVQRWPLIWQKTSPCLNQSASYNFTKNFEIAMLCRKGRSTLVTPMSSSIFACSRTGYISNPFAKPQELWTWIIKAVSIQGQTILDPFAGEGSCPKACISIDRIPISIELEETHYNVMLDSMKSLCDVVFRKPLYT